MMPGDVTGDRANERGEIMGERPNRNYAIGSEKNMRGRFVPFVQIRGRFGTEFGDEDGFSTSEQANFKAALHLIRILNARTKSRRKHGYERISGSHLSEALHDLGVTPTEFGILYGTTVERVLTWIDNAEDIPHPVRVMLEMFRVPGALEAARRATREAIEEKEETTDA